MSTIYQWGNLTHDEPLLYKNSQIKIHSVDQFISNISCGGQHFFCFTPNSVLACGNNENGQLGFDGPSHVEQIVQVNFQFKNKIKQISCGWNHTLILDGNGTVYSAGEGANGALGYGRGQNSHQFKPVLHRIVKVSGGKGHSLALSSTKVYGWGNSKNGELGLVKDKIFYEPQQLYVYASYDCFAGQNCSFFATQKGIFSTGLNANGQLGLGHLKKVNMPKKIKIQGKVHKIRGRNYVMIQLSNGEVYMAGSGSFGQYLLPTKIQFFRHSLDFCIGEGLGVNKSQDNKIYVWGINNYGKLALQQYEQIKYPKQNEFLDSMNIDRLENGEKFMVGLSGRRDTKRQFIITNREDYENKKEEMKEIYTKNEDQLVSTPVFQRNCHVSRQTEKQEEKTKLKQQNGFLEQRIANLQQQNQKQQEYINKLQKQYLNLINIVESDTLLKRILSMKKNGESDVALEDRGDSFSSKIHQLKSILRDIAN